MRLKILLTLSILVIFVYFNLNVQAKAVEHNMPPASFSRKAALPSRKTARLVLLNPANKILLLLIKIKTKIKGSEASGSELSKPFWITVGGKIEDSETLLEAAQREGFEETGCQDIEIQKPLWFGRVVLNWKGVLTELQETFFLARYPSLNEDITREYLTDEEQQAIQTHKWCSIEELKAMEEEQQPVSPKGLAKLLEEVISEELSKNDNDKDKDKDKDIKEIDLSPLNILDTN